MFSPSRPLWLEILYPNKTSKSIASSAYIHGAVHTRRILHLKIAQADISQNIISISYTLFHNASHIVTATQRSSQDNEGAETRYRNTYTLNAKLCKWHPPEGAQLQTNDSWRLCSDKCGQNSQLTAMSIVQWSRDTDLLYGPKWNGTAPCPQQAASYASNERASIFPRPSLELCPWFVSCYQIQVTLLHNIVKDSTPLILDSATARYSTRSQATCIQPSSYSAISFSFNEVGRHNYVHISCLNPVTCPAHYSLWFILRMLHPLGKTRSSTEQKTD